MKLALGLLAAAAALFAQAPAGRRQPPKAPARPAATARVSTPAAAPSPRDLKFPPLHTLHPPTPISFTLPNGLRVDLVEQHELPIVGGAVMVRTGQAFDPPDRVGLAALVGYLLRSGGTADKSPDDVDRQLAALGMTASSTMGSTSGLITFVTLRRTAEPSLEFLRRMLEHPAFDRQGLERIRKQMRDSIARRNDAPADVARRELDRLVLGRDSAYGRLMNYNGLDRITAAELRAFHQKYYFPGNMTLGLWGDFDAQQMRALVEKVFGGWNSTGQPVGAFPAAATAPASGIYLGEIKDPMVSYLAIGAPSGLITRKDLPALDVMGLLFNRLQQRIQRRAQGATDLAALNLAGVQLENVKAAWNAGLEHSGVFRITATCRGAATSDAIRAVLDDIAAIRTTEVTDEDLRAAQDAALSNLLAKWDTTAEGVRELLTLHYYGIPLNFVGQYEAGIRAVTKADLLRVARQYLDPAKLTIVVMGNPQVFGTPLEKLNPQVNRLDLTIPVAKPTVIEATPATLAEGRRLLQRAQQAAGGADQLAAVKDYVVEADYQLDPSVAGMGGSTIPQTDRWIAPQFFRQELILPTGRVTTYSDGTSGWIASPQGWGALVGAQLKQQQSDLLRSWFRMLSSDRIPGRTVNAIDQDLVEITDPDGQTLRLEFDSVTGLPKRVLYDTPQANGGLIPSEDTYGDFREVNGIRFPYKVVINEGGRKFADFIVKSLRLNTGLSQADLAARPQ